jgi:hypothetical protein
MNLRASCANRTVYTVGPISLVIVAGDVERDCNAATKWAGIEISSHTVSPQFIVVCGCAFQVTLGCHHGYWGV